MARPLQKDEPGWHAGSWEAPSLYQAWPRQRPGGNLEVQDNDKSTDDLNSYWLLLQTKLNLSESMNAVDLVYCPVFDTLSGGHFASVFLLPAISKAIHMDSLATCGLYELA